MKIIKTGSRRFKNENLYYIHWDVTRNCNFKCEYCCTHDNTEPSLRSDKIKHIIRFFDFIKTNYKKDLVISLFGGEPTLHPHFYWIVGKLGNYEEIQLQTNLSRSLNWWKNLSDIRNDMIIIPSYHHNKISEKNFIEKIYFLKDNFKYVKIKVMWESKYKDEILKIYHTLKGLDFTNISVSLDMVYWNDQNFTEEDFKFYLSQQTDKLFYIEYEENGEIKSKNLSYNEVKAFHKGDVNFHFYRCFSGSKGIFVTYNGLVYSCQSMRNYGFSPLFNILVDEFSEMDKYINKPIICPIDNTCYEIVIPKERVLKKGFV